MYQFTGETDFCVIELEGGKLVVRIDLGSGEATVRSPAELVFNDLRWHKVGFNSYKILNVIKTSCVKHTCIWVTYCIS